MSEPVDYIVEDGEIELNGGRPTARVRVSNTGDRPIQVGSHYHFFEANRGLEFDRRAAYGMRLDIPAGTAVRFEPGDQREVGLVALGGDRIAIGFAALVDGSLDGSGGADAALERAREQGFLGAGAADPDAGAADWGAGAGDLDAGATDLDTGAADSGAGEHAS